MLDKLKLWWHFDAEQERSSADNPLTPLGPEQRRDALPLLTISFWVGISGHWTVCRRCSGSWGQLSGLIWFMPLSWVTLQILSSAHWSGISDIRLHATAVYCIASFTAESVLTYRYCSLPCY